MVSLLCLERFMKKLINIQDKVNFLAECSEWAKSGRKKWNFKKTPEKHKKQELMQSVI